LCALSAACIPGALLVNVAAIEVEDADAVMTASRTMIAVAVRSLDHEWPEGLPAAASRMGPA
jgi:hypothetical protein